MRARWRGPASRRRLLTQGLAGALGLGLAGGPRRRPGGVGHRLGGRGQRQADAEPRRERRGRAAGVVQLRPALRPVHHRGQPGRLRDGHLRHGHGGGQGAHLLHGDVRHRPEPGQHPGRRRRHAGGQADRGARAARPKPVRRAARSGRGRRPSRRSTRSRRSTAGTGAGRWDRFAFTVFFDPEQAPVNHAIFGPEPTFTGEMVAGEVTIAVPAVLPLLPDETPGEGTPAA